MKAFVLMFHFLLPHASGAFGFAPQTAKTYFAATQAKFNNVNPAFWAISRIEEDRKESLFGAMIVPSSDGDALIISAPARKPNAGTYGGDVFKCVIAAFPNGCKSMTSDANFRNLWTTKNDRTSVSIKIHFLVQEHALHMPIASLLRHCLGYKLP
ncbi:hypothetical protein RF11_14559 [Thelohanellus kitauei]|uniref:Uncharacterized protein n=1 Tax=Thelohanellus kitauei TaxID=669202 RepID=A0A0C2MD31_THEKT|nr:hypothetical protein RF11_14559 [Thelohanellus kitauei]